MQHDPFAREIRLVRDAAGDAGRRAFAATLIAAGEMACAYSGPIDGALRMYQFETRHPDALAWDGRSMRSGTVTYVDDQRVEQYIGQQRWIAYAHAQLGDFRPEIGDQTRVVRRGDATVVESTGPNRLGSSPSAARDARSGMTVLRTSPIELGEAQAYAQAVAQRYAARYQAGPDSLVVDFAGNAQLDIRPAPLDDDTARAVRGLLSQIPRGAARLTVTAHSNRLEGARDAERALLLYAALLGSDGETLAVDDTGAVFSADELEALGTRNATRADAFSFAAAAARRGRATTPVWFSERDGVCDELVVFSSRPWRADFASKFLRREFTGLIYAGSNAGDPVIPAGGEFLAPDSPSAQASQRLALLCYETVDLDITFVDAASCTGAFLAALDERPEIGVVLGQPVANAIVIAFGNRAGDTESETFWLEMRRAETLATAIAAGFAARDAVVAADVVGTLYDAQTLQQLAVRRCGKSAAWNARVAAARNAQTEIVQRVASSSDR